MLERSAVTQGLLFEEPNGDVRRIAILDAELTYYRQAFSLDESTQFTRDLMANTPWRQDEIKIHGRAIPLPRLQAWYSDEGAALSYSGMHVEALRWTDELKSIGQRIKALSGLEFNGVLLNCYRDGHDHVGWHSDDESEFGPNPIIASVSFGAARDFILKHRFRRDEKPVKILLEAGSLLVMGRNVQTHWQHQLPKRKRIAEPRLNLTFRNICPAI
ncbi:MAG: alkylated DNA repair dioxygenase AlkB [Gammaproteobacteria bacterium]|jgi:alkylated DNA repair dioxygenase AlkB